VLIRVDRNLPFQQNLAVLDLAVVVLQAPSNRLADLQVLIPKILAIVDTAFIISGLCRTKNPKKNYFCSSCNQKRKEII
jgi:hypothetical protein